MHERLKTMSFPLELLLSVAVAPALWNEFTKALGARDFFTACSIFMFVGVSGYLVYASRPKVHVPELPDTCNFRFGGGEQQWKAWPRKTQLIAAVEAVKSAQNKVVVAVAGPSGAGKSTFLEDELVPTLVTLGFKPTYYSEYCGELPTPDLDGEHQKSVLIYDQFEHLLLQIWHSDGKEALASLMKIKQQIGELLSTGSVVVCVRAESYYDLRFLASYLPQIEAVVDVGLVSFESEPNIVKAFHGQMRKMCAEATDLMTGSFTLLEMQSRLALEELCRKTDFSRQKGFSCITTHSAPQVLVDWYVDDSPNIPASCRVLYALNQRPAGLGLTVNELAYAVGDRVKSVQEVCAYLETRGLLRREKSAVAFEIAYDALRPRIEACTDERLRPNERDCIASALQAAEESGWSEDVVNQDRRVRFSLALPVMTLLTIIGILRLFFNWDAWYALSSMPIGVRGAGSVDPLYLAIMVPHILWCLYVALHDYRVFRFIDTSSLQRTVSHATVLNLVVCILLGVFLPEYWIIAIAWGGTGQAAKSLAISLRRDISPVAVSVFQRRAIATFINMLATAAAGAVFAWAVNAAQLKASGVMLGVTYAAAFTLTLEMAILFESHISEDEAAYMKNLLRHRLR